MYTSTNLSEKIPSKAIHDPQYHTMTTSNTATMTSNMTQHDMDTHVDATYKTKTTIGTASSTNNKAIGYDTDAYTRTRTTIDKSTHQYTMSSAISNTRTKTNTNIKTVTKSNDDAVIKATINDTEFATTQDECQHD